MAVKSRASYLHQILANSGPDSTVFVTKINQSINLFSQADKHSEREFGSTVDMSLRELEDLTFHAISSHRPLLDARRR